MGVFDSLKRASMRNRLYKEYLSLVGRGDRVAILKAQELAIHLDTLAIWEYQKYIPSPSMRVAYLSTPRISIMGYPSLVLANREHDLCARGTLNKSTTVGLKDALTGLPKP